MKLVPYLRNNELRPMSNMLSLFDDFFNRVYEDESSDDNFRAMAMDIVELDKESQIMANLPGLKKRVAVSNPLFSIKTNRTGLM